MLFIIVFTLLFLSILIISPLVWCGFGKIFKIENLTFKKALLTYLLVVSIEYALKIIPLGLTLLKINNAFIVVDEIQNMTAHELKTVITRVGENSKIVLMGDIEQIDNVYIDETTNGLTYAVEKFKSHDIAGHMTLVRGERSKVATLAAKIL